MATCGVEGEFELVPRSDRDRGGIKEGHPRCIVGGHGAGYPYSDPTIWIILAPEL